MRKKPGRSSWTSQLRYLSTCIVLLFSRELYSEPELLTEGSSIDLEFRAGQSILFAGNGYERWRNMSSVAMSTPYHSYFLQSKKPELDATVGELAFEYRSVPWLGVGFSAGVEEYRFSALPVVSNKLYGFLVFHDIFQNGFPATDSDREAFRNRIKKYDDLRLVRQSGSALTQSSLKMEITFHLPVKDRRLEPRFRMYAGGGPGFLTVGVAPGTRFYFRDRNFYVTGEMNFQTFMSAGDTGFVNLTEFPIGVMRETSARMGAGISFQ